MPNKHTTELLEMGIPQLVERLAEEKDRYFKLRFQHATGQLPNSATLTHARREIARINTILRAKEIAAAEAGESK